MVKQKRSKKVPRIIILAAIVFLSFILQSTPGLPNRIGRAGLFYLIPLVICIGIFETVAVSTWLGLFAGVLWDCVSAEVPGFHSIMLMCFGCISALLINHLLRKNLAAAMIMGVAGIIFYCFIYWFFFLWLRSVPDAGVTFWSVYFPSAVITVVTLPIFYFIISFISKKLKN